MATYDTWGGSWGASWGLSWTRDINPVVVDTHDDADAHRRHTEATRRRDEEYRRKREELRAQLLSAVERVTGKPPPLDVPLKGLASIARRSEGFDYQAVLRDIEAIERLRTAETESAAKRQEDIDNENAKRILLLLTIL